MTAPDSTTTDSPDPADLTDLTDVADVAGVADLSAAESDRLDIPELVGRLTLEEKAALCLGSDFWHTAPVERLGIPRIMVSDGPHGLRTQLNEADHVGLSGSVPATCFPTASALGSSWDPELFELIGAALADEARRWGVSVVLGPGINMKRSPLCGRNFEYLSEDPYLAGELATAMVQGTQRRGIGTSLKHYAANNQEDDRLRVSAEVDERTLREIYLPAFERVVTASQPWTVMCAYNKVNGVYASEHHWLLTKVLRDEWGFLGLVVSDWGAVHDRVAALRAGLDLEMPPQLGISDAKIVEAVRSGTLSEAVVDLAVSRVLQLVDRSLPARAEGGIVDETAHHALARRAAAESAVLLKNDGLLPLRPAAGARVAVIGEFARTARYQGAGSSQVSPTRLDVPLDELIAAFGPGVEVEFAAGFTIEGGDDDARLADEAVQAAERADHVVLFLGLPAAAESEGFDRSHIDLPGTQLALVERLAATGTPVVVTLSNGSVVRLSTWESRVGAIVEFWLSGQAAGGAMADVLTGRVNPSGKLAETIPVRLEDNPSFLNFPGDTQVVRYGEGIFIGYRAYDRTDRAVSYPFGFGLSYTTFALSELAVEVRGSVKGGDLAASVSVSISNTGAVAGAEVVQVYVGDVESEVARPIRELKGFAKVHLEPGETRRVTIQLDQRAFSFWSIRWHRWAVEAGEFEIAAGTSSRDLPLRERISVDAPSLAAPLSLDSTLNEWLAHGVIRQILLHSPVGHLIADAELVNVVGSMPMSTLAAFGPMGVPLAKLREMLDDEASTEAARNRGGID
ncbi:MAG TPA: glycoside hydrolase family 3 C-terminal domain-containing protein [Microlunatus sp.]|nr:glycoside hydrolase family 3 C-terminal domain-containing protein [Microlunatus sp.]